VHSSWLTEFRSLIDAPSPAVLTTYRRDGTAVPSPVWYRLHGKVFEVVIAEGDVKLRHLAHRPQCSLVIFEAVAPFRGIRIEGEPALRLGDVTLERKSIAVRYLGRDLGTRFAAERNASGVLLTMLADTARTWNLSSILPDS